MWACCTETGPRVFSDLLGKATETRLLEDYHLSLGTKCIFTTCIGDVIMHVCVIT